MPEPALLHAGSAEVLTGRLAEYTELRDLLAERPGLTVASADPWSGTSALVDAAIGELEGARLIVDARPCADALDLAMAIGDAAVSRLEPEAAGWWAGSGPHAGSAGLRLSRKLSRRGVDLDALRLGVGPGDRRLSEAIELLLSLAGGDALLAIDHLGLMLSTMSNPDGRQLLAMLRAARQDHVGLDLLLVEHPDGPVSAALGDPDNPLYRSGQLLRLRRPNPARFVDDLAVTRAWTDVRVDGVAAAAELAGGVPALTWRILELAPPEGEDNETRALAGWNRLRAITSPQTARQWDLLRRVHPACQPVVGAMSVGLRPHAVAANPKSVNDALSRMRGLGLAWQPEPRRWMLGDPLLAAWARDNAPPWARRRR